MESDVFGILSFGNILDKIDFDESFVIFLGYERVIVLMIKFVSRRCLLFRNLLEFVLLFL